MLEYDNIPDVREYRVDAPTEDNPERVVIVEVHRHNVSTSFAFKDSANPAQLFYVGDDQQAAELAVLLLSSVDPILVDDAAVEEIVSKNCGVSSLFRIMKSPKKRGVLTSLKASLTLFR